MRHNSKKDLPSTIRALPEGAQEIYLEAYNHAWDEYERDPAGAMAIWRATRWLIAAPGPP
jgi:cation transport regulator ChaB